MEWEEQIGEEANLSSWEELYENLSELAEHPFNINTVTKEELEQLPFLSDKMVENILYYVYKYGPLVSLNELWGVEGISVRIQTSCLLYFHKFFQENACFSTELPTYIKSFKNI
jgi:hypothetical protein